MMHEIINGIRIHNPWNYPYEKALDEGDDIVSCGWYISNDNTILAESNDTYINPIPGGIVGDILTQRYSSWVWNKLVKRSLYDQILFFPTKNVLEDICVVIQLYYYSAKPSILNQSLYYYYFNPNSITNKLEGYRAFLRELKEKAKKNVFLLYIRYFVQKEDQNVDVHIENNRQKMIDKIDELVLEIKKEFGDDIIELYKGKITYIKF